MLLSYSIYAAYVGASFQDAVIIGILSSLSVARFYFKEYFRLKEKVITENDFREKVNLDIADLQNKIASVKIATNPNLFGGKR